MSKRVQMSSTKQAALLAEVQKNPEILTANATYVNRVILHAGDFATGYCHLPVYPEELQGYAQGGAGASTDLSALTSNTIMVSIDGSGYQELTLTLASCDTGANTAAHLQTLIRAETDLAGWDEATCTYVGASYYLITSGRYGAESNVSVGINTEDYKHVAMAMKLMPRWGSVEVPGAHDDFELDVATVTMVESMYAAVGAEGLASVGTFGGVSFTVQNMNPKVRMMLNHSRGLWST